MTSTEVGVADRAPPDVRLVPAAVTIWLAGLLGLAVTWWLALACGLAALVISAVLLSRARSRMRAVGMAAALMLAGLITAGPLTLQLHSSAHDPLRVQAETSSQVDARVGLIDRPRQVASTGFGNQDEAGETVRIAATVETISSGGTPMDSTGRVVLLAPAAQWSHLLPGQQVSVSGTLRPARGGDLTVAAIHVEPDTVDRHAEPREVSEAPWWQRTAHGMRAGLGEVAGVLAEEEAGLLSGLVVGDTEGMSQRVVDEFRASGLAHLVAVSGLHVGIVCGAVLFVLRAMRVGPRTSAGCAGLVLVGYMITVGYAPSVLRAGVMGAVGLLALFLGRQRSAMPALAFAVAVLVLYDVQLAVDFGFAMSVAATAALVLVAPRWIDTLRARGVPAGWATVLVIPVVAFMATAPLIAGMAGHVSIVTVLANVLATPVVALATVLGVLATVTAGFAPWLAEFLVRLAGPELSWLVFVAREAAAVPGGVLNWPGGWLGGLLLALVIAAAVLACHRRGFRLVLAVGSTGLLVGHTAVQVLAPPWPPADWAFVACDVGQGDGLVLATGTPGHAVVVDTGDELGGISACLDRMGIGRIPLLVLTHLHDDHTGGLASVLGGRQVDGVAVGPGRTPRGAWNELVDTTERHDVPLLEPTVGDRMEWPNLQLDVLGPVHVPAEQAREPSGSEINNVSLVLMAQTRVGRVLLTGDVEVAAQADLLASEADLRADVIKIPHHGSGYTLPEFLAAADPEVAVISVGRGNSHGHPDPELVERLAQAETTIARTDTDGDIALVATEQAAVLTRRGPRSLSRDRPRRFSVRVPRAQRRPSEPPLPSAPPIPRSRPTS